MGGLVVLLSGVVSDWMDGESLAGRRFVARQMALSGIALGLNPVLKPGDPLLRSGSPDGEGYEVRIGNEAAKINPNFWIQQGDRPMFLRLFEGWGVEIVAAEAAIDGLIDWIDGDDFLSLKGAERGEYERAGRPGRGHTTRVTGTSGLTWASGFSPCIARMRFSTAAMACRCTLSSVREPMWGVTTQVGRFVSGWPARGGSSSSTSVP